MHMCTHDCVLVKPILSIFTCINEHHTSDIPVCLVSTENEEFFLIACSLSVKSNVKFL